MPTYVMLSHLGPDGYARLQEDPERIKEVNAEVAAMGATIVQQYALLGQYDFLNILECPDEATMFRVATALAARGTVRTMTLQASPIEAYIAALNDAAG